MPATPEQLAGGIRGSKRAAEQRTRDTDEFYAPILPVIRELRAEGLGVILIGKVLNQRGYRTRWGCRWGKLQVRRVCRRYGIE